MNALKAKADPERTARKIVMDCADCDCCRPIMDESCLFFPELYRLFDREAETGRKPSSEELRRLVDRCNFCALCPCPNIRADIIRAKTGFAERDGLPFGVRAVQDVARIGKVCGALPGLANQALKSGLTSGLIKKAVGIHPDRSMPEFPGESFTAWARNQGLQVKPNAAAGRKAAYFAGCTARYMFPEVAKSTVEVLRRNDVQVHCPEQKCCGMPSFLEGDRNLTLEFAEHNLGLLADAGVMGFKRDFHEASIELGSRLMRKIEELNPETLLTDCLSCRLQFNQQLRCEVKHPIEFLAESYRQGSAGERDEV